MNENAKVKQIIEKIKLLGHLERFNKTYEIMEPLGKGAQGEVFSLMKRANQKMYCVKKVRTSVTDSGQLLVLLREILCLKYNTGPGLLKAKRIFIYIDSEEESLTSMIVTQKMETDLKNVIYSNQPLCMEQIRFIAFYLAKGILSLHNNNILHRDIKPGNVLVNKDCSTVLCDFGMCRYIDRSNRPNCLSVTELTSGITTRWYRAPEVCFGAAKYFEPIDVWAFGCVVVEMILRRPFLKGTSDDHQIELIFETFGHPPSKMQSEFPHKIKELLNEYTNIPKSLKMSIPGLRSDLLDLLEKIFVYDPSKRISIEGVISHDFFKPLCKLFHNSLTKTLEKITGYRIGEGIFDFEHDALDPDRLLERIYLETYH